MWIRNQEVTLGEAEGRERSREIGRQRETGGLGGEKERHRVGREEWVGVFCPPLPWYLGTGTPRGEERGGLEVLEGQGPADRRGDSRDRGAGHWEGVAQRPPGHGGCSSSERPSRAGSLGCAGGGR